MQNGANSVHKLLRTELEDYIKSQYFGKSPLLLSALSNHIDDEGLLYQKPFIESSPAYVTVPNGINTASIEPWMKEYFLQLAQAGIGVFISICSSDFCARSGNKRRKPICINRYWFR